MRNLYRLVKTLPLFEDCRSTVAFLRLAKSCFWKKVTDSSPVSLRLKPLGGRSICCRPNTRDASVLMYVFGERYHLPPPEIGPVHNIIDLGSNIGLTVASYAALYPDARILGVELDSGNAALCRRNVEPWSAKVEVICGAVWPHDGEVAYSGDGEDAYRVASPGGSISLRTAPALSMSSLLDRFGSSDVDFVKMDIEGAEEQVLDCAEGWIRRVRCLSVEVHQPYSVARCMTALARFGFRCTADHRDPPCVLAVRNA